MAIQLNTVQAKEAIIDCMKAKLVPFLTGSPGMGKSSIIHEIAEEFNLELIDIRLSQCDPSDLMGFPSVDQVTGKASYKPMATFPLVGDPLPKGKTGWLLFLDEFNSAPRAVQAASYKLVLDRMVGMEKLHPNVAIACAGNLGTDNAIVNQMSTAMQSRLIHLELGIDANAWLEWASEKKIDYRVTSFIQFRKDLLFRFDPNHSDKTFPCSRTWHFVSDLIKGWTDIPHSKLALIAGTIGEGVAREFVGFCKIFQKLPNISQIVSQPTKVKIPEEPSVLFAISGMIGHETNQKNITPVMEFIERLPLEFQIITIRDIVKRDRKMVQEPSLKAWISNNAEDLF